jgi:sterol desaturase/sphingolipid hydroxylase (fatty acid hydroxylase superfamily)
MTDALTSVLPIKIVLPVAVLITLWTWESIRPFFRWRDRRLRHAVRNLAMTVFNTIILSLVFGAVTIYVAAWTARNSFGMLDLIGLAGPLKFVVALIFLDLWMYLWHRANHMIPILWRFHRTHHSDHRMDVTSATRFHLGEHVFASILRLGLIPLLGFGVWHIVVYDIAVIAVTQFHHANISLGRYDWWIRMFIVTPDMHKVHHSRWKPETDSNYSVVLSIWDRLAGSFRMRNHPAEIDFGLDDFDEDQWQTFWGLLKTPFRETNRKGVSRIG